MEEEDWAIKVLIPDPKKTRRNGELLPDSIRCLIVGPSGCGKTTLMIDNFLLSPGWLDLQDRYIYIYTRSLNQPKYQTLKRLFDAVNEELGKEVAIFPKELIPLEDCRNNSIVIFDDFILENQNIVRDYFTKGRHKYIDCFYLAQTYSRIPKQLVRDNANFICLFRQDETNLKHVFSEYVNGDCNFNSFLEMCRNCWNDRTRASGAHSFLTIATTRKTNEGKYRKKINGVLTQQRA